MSSLAELAARDYAYLTAFPLCPAGYNINHMDLAPNFAGTLMGLTNCVATLAGVLAPFATGYVINEHVSWEDLAHVTAE